MKTLVVLAVTLIVVACDATGPEIDTLGPGDGTFEAPQGALETAERLSSADVPRVRAILPDGRVVLLRDTDLMPGRFVARSARFRVNAAVWAGER